MPVPSVVLEISEVYRSSLVHSDAIAIFHVVLELAFVHRAGYVSVLSFAFLHVIFPLAFVNVPVRVHVLAKSMPLPVHDIASIRRAVFGNNRRVRRQMHMPLLLLLPLPLLLRSSLSFWNATPTFFSYASNNKKRYTQYCKYK